jgi:hypothetical protein
VPPFTSTGCAFEVIKLIPDLVARIISELKPVCRLHAQMSPFIDTAVIRTLALEELPSELQSLQLKCSDESITQQLLDAIERGSISTSVFGVWLRFCKSPVVIKQALRQKISVRIRHAGIKQLRSGLESSRWEQIWEGLGGTAGLLGMFGDLSVEEVKAACKAINRLTCNGDLTRTDADLIRKRACVTEFFKCLHPKQFPDAVAKSRDLRPLTEYYQLLVPSCTAEIVDWVTSIEQEGKWQFVKERDLLKHHSETIGKAAIHNMFDTQSLDVKSKDRLQKLSRQYPPSSSSKHGFSASMVFALSLLRRIVETDAKDVGDSWVVSNLIRPLLRRAIRKRVAWSQNQQIVDLAVRFFEHRPDATKCLKSSKGDVLHMVAICWSRRSGLFEAHLKRLMDIVFGKKTAFEDFADLLTGIPRSRRYTLLHMCCLEVLGVDLESEVDLSKLQGVLQYYTLYALEAEHALILFQRLRRARGDANLISVGPYNSVLSTRRSQVGFEGDPDINLLVLLNRTGRHEEAEIHAIKILEIRKQAAQTSTNRETRAEQVLSVWACANASGSIKLLREILQWAKGFIRDQLTASRLFSAYYDETYRLLSGFPVHGIWSLKSRDLRLRVEAANAFMMDMIEVAREGLREPSFRTSDWHKMIGSFTSVVKLRIELSAELKRETRLSDEDIYSSLWEDTIAMLLRAERVLNSEEYEKLDAATISGLVVWRSLSSHMPHSKTVPLEKSTWRFIDTLAEARNSLWTELRPLRHPDVLTLPAPFPRGLPVQHLLALWSPNVLELDHVAPYVSSRVQETLFADPERALKPVLAPDPLMPAIGYFVDSYNYALTTYIPQDCDKKVKQARLLKAWNYAIGPLSLGRMEGPEAIRFWKPFVPSYLQSTLVDIQTSSRSVPWRPAIPTSDEPSQIQDWNPLEGRPLDVKIEARELTEPTYIDFCTSGQQTRHTKPDVGAFHDAPKPYIPVEYHPAPSLWSPSESFTLAALLVLDAKYGTTDRLLTEPFPSSSDVRFPCVFLDEEFLSSEEVKSSAAASYITNNLVSGYVDVPLPLVHKMTAGLVGKLDTQDSSQALEATALGLLKALADGDRPGLAFDLAIKVIMEQPDASSWHRILFNKGFLQRVPASDARAYIEKYADAIGERLDVLDSFKLSKTDGTGIDSSSSSCEDGTSQPDKPMIKVTTLKSLAQLLHGSKYIDEDVSLRILLNLCKKVKHIDVRVSILKTLLSKLKADRPELWDSVLSALGSFIPLVIRLDERQPGTQIDLSSEDDTSSMRETGQSNASSIDKPSIPVMRTTTNIMWQEGSPMLAAFLDHFEKLEGVQLWQAYMDRIMLPLMDGLIEQTANWTTLFLENFAPECVDVLKSDFPFVPKGSQILETVLSSKIEESKRIPRRALNQLFDYLVFHINPPGWVRILNQRLRDDRSLKALPEVETWLTLYGSESLIPSRVLPYFNISSFEKSPAGEHDAYITRDSYREAFVKVFSELLWVDGPSYTRLSALVSTIYVDLADDADEDGRSTIEHLVAHVNSLRTRAWEQNPDRTPAVLPDTFMWRLNLLTYPDHTRSDSDEAREKSSKDLAQQLTTLIDEISGSVYHAKLQQIKEHFKDEEGVVLTAIHLGNISKTRLSWLTMPELLKVDLAAEMLLRSKGRDIGPLGNRVRELLGTWTASENEDVRRTGYRLRGELLDADGEWQKTASRTSWW